MNILELCLGPDLGGLELYFHRCCVELSKAGHHVISVRQEGGRLDELAKRDNIPTYYFSRENKFFPLANARRLSQLITKNKIDILHAHWKDDLALIALTKSICKTPFKLVFTRQMPMPHKKKDIYHRWIYSKIDLFITITEKLKNDALQNLPISATKIKRLYYGVAASPAIDQDYTNEFLNISQPGDFNIGVFSRLEFQKGQHLVIEALHKLKERDIAARLYVVGHVMDEQYKQTLQKRIEETQLQSQVSFKGFLQQPVKAMQGMDVLILPSRNEAFGLVLIEAMRCGMCVLGVNAGGVPEIIDHNQTGLLFEWDRPDQLADQLEFLYKNPTDREAIATRGKQKADEKFNSEQHFQSLQQMFSDLLA